VRVNPFHVMVDVLGKHMDVVQGREFTHQFDGIALRTAEAHAEAAVEHHDPQSPGSAHRRGSPQPRQTLSQNSRG